MFNRIKIHKEQYLVIYKDINTSISQDTIEYMRNKLGTGYYTPCEEIIVQKKLSLTESSEAKSDESFGDNTPPLERANLTIRRANLRISELKKEIRNLKSINLFLRNSLLESESNVSKLNSDKDELLERIEFLTTNSNSCELSDLDIMGFEDYPNSQILRKRYKTLASLYHPDKSGSHKMMARLNDAYSRLK